MVNRTQIHGKVRGTDGVVYEGAIIDIYLNKPKFYEDAYVSNNVLRTYTNSYGNFSFKLVPNSADDYYTIRILYDNDVNYNVKVPVSSNNLNLLQLEKWVSPSRRIPLIGGGFGFFQNGVLVTGGLDLGGSFIPQPTLPPFVNTQFVTVFGNGSQTTFSAPGTILKVYINGLIQTEGIDFSRVSSNTIQLLSTYFIPDTNDTVTIEYGVS